MFSSKTNLLTIARLNSALVPTLELDASGELHCKNFFVEILVDSEAGTVHRIFARRARLLGGPAGAISNASRTLALVLGCLASLTCGCSEAAATPHGTPLPPLQIRLTGDQMEWHVRYPGLDDRLDTADDILSKKDIHFPATRPVKILLTSRDLLYTLAIPRHRIHEIAVPQVEFALDLPPDRPGEYPFQGDQMCGFQHDLLFGRIFVHHSAEFDGWIRSQSRR